MSTITRFQEIETLKTEIAEKQERLKELESLQDEVTYWEDLANELGWSLMGFTYKQRASFVDGNDDIINLTGAQRDDIIRALELARD